MGADLYAKDPYARQVFDEVESATGLNVATLCFESDEETLRETQNAQIALYTCSLAAYYAFRGAEPGVEAEAFAGHSVGEYAALAAAGVLSVAEGARLVRRRGEIMASAGKSRPGTMAAVLGLERDTIEAVCACVAPSGVCVLANDNCPGQMVISGDIDAVQAASAKLSEKGAKRVIPLNVSGAFHSPLMEQPAAQMAEALGSATFNPGHAPVYSNVTARPGSDWPTLLEQQLKSLVRWTESVQAMVADGFSIQVECGSGDVLKGLLRRIDKDTTGLTVVDTATLEATVATLKESA